MMCPRCGEEENKTIDSRSMGPHRYRTRECVSCKYRWKTVEMPRKEYEKIIKEAIHAMQMGS